MAYVKASVLIDSEAPHWFCDSTSNASKDRNVDSTVTGSCGASVRELVNEAGPWWVGLNVSVTVYYVFRLASSVKVQ